MYKVFIIITVVTIACSTAFRACNQASSQTNIKNIEDLFEFTLKNNVIDLKHNTNERKGRNSSYNISGINN